MKVILMLLSILLSTYIHAQPNPTKQSQEAIKNILAFEEGLGLRPYICSEGYVTIGYGTKLHKNRGMKASDFPLVINEAIATEMLNDDVSEIIHALQNSKQGDVYRSLSQTRKNIIVSMAYQLGVTGVLKFKNTWKALEAGDWELASKEMLDSKWFIDTPERAERHATVILDGSMITYNMYF